MFRFIKKHGRLCAAFIVLLALAGGTERAWAHGMGWRSDASFSIVVRFQYDDGEPMAYGAVKVFSPADGKVQHQGGRSDRNGYFSFRPDVAGVWTFEGDDGQGHVTRGEIEVTEAELTGDAGPDTPPRSVVVGGAQKPNVFQILLGLSILLNIALGSLWLQAKKGRAGVAGPDKERC